MRPRSVLPLLLGLVVVQTGWAQQPPASQVLSPEVHPDRRVTFRLFAPKATEVALTGEFIDGPQQMRKDDAGVWSLTLGPIEPEIYEYEYTVDGVTNLDPRNPAVKYNRGPAIISSLLRVPASSPTFYDLRPVPHGTVAMRWYDSKATRTTRRAHIYTPPNYERGTARLPVLYLIHGGDGEDSGWTAFGRANIIIDNLIADGKMAPMIVVMPFGYAYAWDAGASNEQQQADFLKDLTEDLIPFVEANYRVAADREHRALAGLSRGGSQTLNIGLRRLDLFSRLGVFSSSGGADPAATFKDVADNAANVNAQLKMFWIGMGTEDGGFARAKALSDFLNASQITHTFRTIPGAHTWIVWRKFLNEVAPQLWPQS